MSITANILSAGVNEPRKLIATLNLQWCGDPTPDNPNSDRRALLAKEIHRLDAEVLVLTEFKSGSSGDQMTALLEAHGYPHVLQHADMPFGALGTAIASKAPPKPLTLANPPPFDPWRVNAFSWRGLEVYGLYAPANVKIRSFWEWILSLAPEVLHRPALFIGDFNTGVNGEDEYTCRFTCHDQYGQLKSLGFQDLWRRHYPEARDFTWYSQTGNGFRLDHALATPRAAGRVCEVWIDHSPRLNRATDHSALTLAIASTSPRFQ